MDAAIASHSSGDLVLRVSPGLGAGQISIVFHKCGPVVGNGAAQHEFGVVGHGDVALAVDGDDAA